MPINLLLGSAMSMLTPLLLVRLFYGADPLPYLLAFLGGAAFSRKARNRGTGVAELRQADSNAALDEKISRALPGILNLAIERAARPGWEPTLPCFCGWILPTSCCAFRSLFSSEPYRQVRLCRWE